MNPSQFNLPQADAELWGLVDAFVDGSATPVQNPRLESRLAAEAQARLFYVAYLDLHAYLQWSTRGQAAPARQRQPAHASLRGYLAWLSPSPSPKTVAAALALAATLVIAMLVFRPWSEEEDPLDVPAAPAGSVAVLIELRNTVWDQDMALPTVSGSALPPGRLKLRSGIVEVAFNGGGEILLEGPAEFDLSASDHGVLHRGKLTARVAPGAQPFKVSMPGVVVTDLGGECGLLQDESGLTEIHVFDGQVGADPVDRQGEVQPGKRLLGNTGTRFDSARQTMTSVPLNEETFAALRPAIRATGVTVRDGTFSGQNFGSASFLMVKNSIPSYSWESFLRFDLAGVKGHVSKATVRLMPVKLGQPIENAVAFVPDNRWTETTMTWDTKPASGEAFTTWTAELEKAVEFDVTRFVQQALVGDRQLSLRIFAPVVTRGNSYVQYGSRKGGFEARPELHLTMAP